MLQLLLIASCRKIIKPKAIADDVLYTQKDKHKTTSSPKGNDAHLRVIIQSEKKWKHQFFRRLRAANSVVRGRI